MSRAELCRKLMLVDLAVTNADMVFGPNERRHPRGRDLTIMVRDHVLFLRGIAAGSRSLRRLAFAIASHGYEMLNLAYPSRKMSLAGLVVRTIEITTH